MKLTFISDTHDMHDKVITGSGDILFHCGDMTGRGEIHSLEAFARFMEKQDFKHKVVISGNHDFCFENGHRGFAEKIMKDHGIIYLNDNFCEIEGLKIWGSPVQPRFFDWAFNRDRGEDIKSHWDMIPSDTDILITHGPPYDILDQVRGGGNVGCVDLLDAVKRVRPRIHAFGHIHEDYGVVERDGTVFVNACSADHKYRLVNKPITIVI